MINKLSSLLGIFLLQQTLIAEDTPDKVALNFSNALADNSDFSRELSIFGFAEGISLKKRKVASYSATSSDPVISALNRVSQWKEFYYNDQYDFKILETKQQGDFAITLISSLELGSPFEGDVHRICMVKQAGAWKIAPMISNFTYANKGDTDNAKDSKSILEWAVKRESEYLASHVGQRKNEFESRIDIKRKEILTNVKNADDLVEFFFEQVKAKSINGLCAVSGYTAKRRLTLGGQNCNSLLQSFSKGLGEEGFDRGAWSSLLSEEAVVTHLDTIKMKNDNGDYVLYGIVHPDFDECIQVVCFEVFRQASGYILKIPEPLVAELDGNDYEFNYDEFNSWNLPNPVRNEWNTSSLKFFKNHKKTHSNSLKEHRKKLALARENDDFKAFLSYHTSKEQLENHKALNYLKQICEDYSRHEDEYAGYQTISSSYDEKRSSAVVFELKLDYVNVSNSAIQLNAYIKEKSGWLSCEKETSKEIAQLSKAFGEDEEEIIENFLKTIRDNLIKIDTVKEVNGTIREEEIKQLGERFIKSLLNENYNQLSAMSCDVRNTKKTKLGSIQKFFTLQAEYLNADSIELTSYRVNSSGFASFALKVTRGEEVKEFMHFAVNTGQGLRVDCSNVVEFGVIGRLSRKLNQIKFKNLSDFYPDSAVDFFTVTYGMMDQATKK